MCRKRACKVSDDAEVSERLVRVRRGWLLTPVDGVVLRVVVAWRVGHRSNSSRAAPAPAGGELQPRGRGGPAGVMTPAGPIHAFYPISRMISCAFARSRSA